MTTILFYWKNLSAVGAVGLVASSLLFLEALNGASPKEWARSELNEPNRQGGVLMRRRRARLVSSGVALWIAVALSSAFWTPLATATSKPRHPQDPSRGPRAHVDTLESDGGGVFFRIAGVGVFAASAGDLATTEWGLRRSGAYEANPLAAHRTARLATHLAAPAVVWWATDRMHRRGHRRLALLLRVGLMVAYSYATVHNVRTATRP